jgi:peptide chain release factor 1
MLDPRHIEALRRKAAALEQNLADPVLCADPAKYRRIVAEHSRLQRALNLVADRDRLRREQSDLERMASEPEFGAELAELARADLARVTVELARTEQALAEALVPPEPTEERSVIMEIRAGTGGDEAALFAADLFRMYSRYADRKGWRVSVMDVSASDLGGYKEIIFSVEGPSVFEWLRYESGVHRVQRVPITEQQGRIHTSTATVAVLPEAAETDEIIIRPEEIRIDLFRASGPGGQKVNKTESAVRITHLPTGLVVTCQDERSQTRNREKAMRVLRARLLDRKLQKEAQRISSERRAQIGTGDRSERVRTYNFPQNRVTDHRINLTLYRLTEILDGDLDELISQLRAQHRAQRLDAALNELAS